MPGTHAQPTRQPGQPYQEAGKVPDLIGRNSRTHW